MNRFIQASIAPQRGSKQRIYLSLGGIGSIFLLAVGIWSWLNYTTPGPLTQIGWNLIDVSQWMSPRHQSEAAVAFAKDENFTQALKLANEIQDSPSKVDALSAIAAAYGKLDKPEKAALLLDKAIASANQIQDPLSKAYALIAIAAAYGKLDKPEKAALLLDKAIASANQIQISPSKAYALRAYALRAIAEAYGKLNQPEKAALLLDKAIASANQIQESNYKAYALIAIAEAYGKLNQPEKAALLLDKAIAAANQIQYPGDKANALSAIAEAAANLKNWGQALQVTQQCPSNDCKVESLAKVLTVHAEQQHPE